MEEFMNVITEETQIKTSMGKKMKNNIKILKFIVFHVFYYIGENMICNQQCQILCTPNHTRCPSCVQLRSTLTARRLCLKSQCPEKVLTKVDPTSTHRYSLLSKEEMKSRMKTMHDKITKIKKQKNCLTEKVKLLVEKQSSIELNPSDHQDMIEIIQKEGYTVCHQSNTTEFQ